MSATLTPRAVPPSPAASSPPASSPWLPPSSSAPPSAPATGASPAIRPRRAGRRALLRRTIVQVHGWAGVTLGLLLAVVAATGAMLSFRAELLEVANPGVVTVPTRTDDATARRTPSQIGAAVVATVGERRVATLTLFDRPGAAARVVFVARPDEYGGETAYADPYTGELRPLHGDAFFETVEALHRWLLLPRAAGRIATGTLAIALLAFLATGLYLRWPKNRALRWRAWLTWRPGLHGRSYWWSLHAVVATWILPLLVVSAATGIYWSFDAVREPIDRWAGQPREARKAMRATDATAMATASTPPAASSAASPPDRRTAAPSVDQPAAASAVDRLSTARSHAQPWSWPGSLDAAWAAFRQRRGDTAWRSASLRVPERPGQAIQITWIAADAGYDRARNRMTVDPVTGRVSRDDRHADTPLPARALTWIYPLHTGNWSLAGRIATALASIGLVLLAGTGGWLFLKRR